MKARELMTQDVSAVSAQDSIVEAAKIMQQRNVGCIPVCESGKNVNGILTDRDIVLRGVAEDRNLKQTKVNQVMTSNVTYANPEMDAHEVARIMSQHQIRRLPVVENGNLLGIVSLGDLATHNIHIDEAGDALSDISSPSKPLM